MRGCFEGAQGGGKGGEGEGREGTGSNGGAEGQQRRGKQWWEREGGGEEEKWNLDRSSMDEQRLASRALDQDRRISSWTHYFASKHCKRPHQRQHTLSHTVYAARARKSSGATDDQTHSFSDHLDFLKSP